MPRQERVAAAIKRDVSLIIHDKLKDPRIGFVTITGVEISNDLRNAKVFYSVLGTEENYKKTQEALDSAQGLVRSLIGDRLGMRFSPEIIFRQDRSNEYGSKIDEVINQIHALEGSTLPIPAPRRVKRKVKKDEPKKSSRRIKKTR